MSKRPHGALTAALLALLLAGCAQKGVREHTDGRWISFDASTQRYSVAAQQVPRGELLDDLRKVSGAEVRPQPERDLAVTAQAKGVDLDALISLLVPPGTRVTFRPGDREIPAAASGEGKTKQGAALQPVAGATDKPKPLESFRPVAVAGNLKPSAETPYEQRELTGPGAKLPPANLIRTADSTGPKSPLPSRVPRETVRVQMEFREGEAPRVTSVRSVEGRAPKQRFVTGNFLFAVIATDGRLVEAGTFQDPLEEHSYLPEGQHSTGRARAGMAGISVARESLSSGTLSVVDLTGAPMPRELDERTVRTALQRGKPVLQLSTASILRSLEQETRR